MILKIGYNTDFFVNIKQNSDCNRRLVKERPSRKSVAKVNIIALYLIEDSNEANTFHRFLSASADSGKLAKNDENMESKFLQMSLNSAVVVSTLLH